MCPGTNNYAPSCVHADHLAEFANATNQTTYKLSNADVFKSEDASSIPYHLGMPSFQDEHLILFAFIMQIILLK